MALIDLRPGTVDVSAYSGDTCSLKITVDPVELLDGAVWTAQVRPTVAGQVAAEFTVTPIADGATLVLSAAETAALGAFQGLWDCQIENTGTTRTLVKGRFTLDGDVTRAS